MENEIIPPQADNATPAPADPQKALKTFALIALALTVYILLTSALQIGLALISKELLLDVKLSSDNSCASKEHCGRHHPKARKSAFLRRCCVRADVCGQSLGHGAYGSV